MLYTIIITTAITEKAADKKDYKKLEHSDTELH